MEGEGDDRYSEEDKQRSSTARAPRGGATVEEVEEGGEDDNQFEEGDEEVEDYDTSLEYGKPMPLIDPKGEFSAASDELAPGLSGDEDDDEAFVVTVLGPRGSGRSTLLNEVFDCEFEVGKAFGSAKGTKGVFLAVSNVSAKRVLVLDTQGFDGRSSEIDKVNRIATFALCFSDVLIFNLWCADIGRYEAAGYGHLRTLFNEAIELNREDSDVRRTLLLFVARDHDDSSSVESLKSVLMADMHTIWDQMEKPANAGKQRTLRELFDFDLVTLPHPRHRRADFERGTRALRNKLLSEEVQSSSEYSKMVPLEAFGTYLEVTWNDLEKPSVEQPNRRDLVAAYRCDMALDAQHSEAQKVFTRWASEVDAGKIVPRFGSEVSKLLNARMEAYDAATAMHANAAVRGRKRNELTQYLQSNVKSTFQKQILTLQSQALQKFKDQLVSNLTEGSRSAYQTENVAQRNVLEWFSDKAEELVVPEMHLSFQQAKNVLTNVLNEYAERFEDSPTAQLRDIQRSERMARRRTRRQPSCRVSLNLNSALRPKGTGNFQLVTGYSDGPLAANFTLCNDGYAAEQEGLGPMPLFKFQPTLSYDMDL